MNKKIKRKWAAALRGGKWQQCFGRARGLGLNEQQYDSIYLFNDDDQKSFEEIANLIEQSSDLPYHEPRESTPEDLESLFDDYDIAILEMKTPWEIEAQTREAREAQFDLEQ